MTPSPPSPRTLGGVNVITDSSGARCQLNEYDPWGGVSRSEGPTPGTPATCDKTHRFTGQELDPESGLYYYGGRYYDQEISRFISPDPYIQDPEDPQNLNRYTYVLNNPQGYVDPSGHFIEWLIGGLLLLAGSLPEILTAEVITTQMLATLAGKVIAYSAAVSLNQSMKVMSNAELHHEVAKQQQENVPQALPIREGAGSNCLPGDDTCGSGPIQLAAGPCRPAFITCGGPGGDWWGRGGGSGRGSGRGSGPSRYPAPKGPPAETRGAGRGTGGGGTKGIGNEGPLDIKVTTHGETRLAQRGWTQVEIAQTKASAKVLTQADGAKVFIHEASPGKFNVIVEGDQGIITGLKGLDQKALDNLSRNYGWK